MSTGLEVNIGSGWAASPETGNQARRVGGLDIIFSFPRGDDKKVVDATLNFLDPKIAARVGSIVARDVPDFEAVKIAEEFSGRETLRSDRIAPERLRTLLEKLSASADSMSIPGDRSIEQVIRQYSVGAKLSPKPLVSDIKFSEHQRFGELPEGCKGIRWYHIDNIDQHLLQDVAEHSKISDGLAKHILDRRIIPSTLPAGKALCAIIEECKFNPVELALKSTEIVGILGDDYLITLTSGRSDAARNIIEDAKRRILSVEERTSSNYLFSRLLGSVAHINRDSVAAFEQHVDSFAKEQEGKRGGPKGRELVSELQESTNAVRTMLGGCMQVAEALQEQDKLFGASKPKDSLARFASMFERDANVLREVARKLDEIQEGWVLYEAQRSSDHERLTNIIVASLGPAALVCSFFDMGFTSWQPSDLLKIGSVSAVFGGSVAFIFGLKYLRR